MGIQAVSFGNNMQTSAVQAKPAKERKPMGPVKKGAVIGGSIGTGFTALGMLATKGLAKMSGNTFSGLIKEAGGWGKYAFNIAKGIAIYAAIGAAIGGIVRLIKGKEEDDEPETTAEAPAPAPADNKAEEGQNVNTNV